jgi:hypothetical protein
MVLVLFKNMEVKNKAMVVSSILVAFDNDENNDPIGLDLAPWIGCRLTVQAGRAPFSCICVIRFFYFPALVFLLIWFYNEDILTLSFLTCFAYKFPTHLGHCAVTHSLLYNTAVALDMTTVTLVSMGFV